MNKKPLKQMLSGVGPRVETGVVQFGDDWPGVFIRGDQAMWWAMQLRQIISSPQSLHKQFVADFSLRAGLNALAETLAACDAANFRSHESNP